MWSVCIRKNNVFKTIVFSCFFLIPRSQKFFVLSLALCICTAATLEKKIDLNDKIEVKVQKDEPEKDLNTAETQRQFGHGGEKTSDESLTLLHKTFFLSLHHVF